MGNNFEVGICSVEVTGEDEFEVASRIGVSLNEVRDKILKTQQPQKCSNSTLSVGIDFVVGNKRSQGA